MDCQSYALLTCLLDEQCRPADGQEDRLLISSENGALQQEPCARHLPVLFEPGIMRTRRDGFDCSRGDRQPVIYIIERVQTGARSSSSAACRFLHSTTERTPGHSQLSVGARCDDPLDGADSQNPFVSRITSQMTRVGQELPSETPALLAAPARTCGRLAVDAHQVLRTSKVSRYCTSHTTRHPPLGKCNLDSASP